MGPTDPLPGWASESKPEEHAGTSPRFHTTPRGPSSPSPGRRDPESPQASQPLAGGRPARPRGLIYTGLSVSAHPGLLTRFITCLQVALDQEDGPSSSQWLFPPRRVLAVSEGLICSFPTAGSPSSRASTSSTPSLRTCLPARSSAQGPAHHQSSACGGPGGRGPGRERTSATRAPGEAAASTSRPQASPGTATGEPAVHAPLPRRGL